MSNILVVTSDEALALGLHIRLRGPDFAMVHAGCAATAVKTVRQHPVHAVLLDVDSVDDGGVDLVSRLRTVRGASRLPLIRIASDDGVENRRLGAELGEFAFLTKPFEWAHLAAVLRSVVARAPVGMDHRAGSDRPTPRNRRGVRSSALCTLAVAGVQSAFGT